MRPTLPFLLLLAVLAGCQPAPAPTPKVDAGPCIEACNHLRDMSCDAGAPTPAGVPCETWLCQAATMPSGPDSACIVRAVDCSGADRCGR